MSRSALLVQQFYDALYRQFGPQDWWPGDGPVEIMIGAVLTQNTSWRNVERAIANLSSAGLIDMTALCEVDIDRLAALIRPAGYFNIKARRLKNLTEYVCDNYDGDVQMMFELSGESLREELLSISGIGKETADSIALYAAGKPTFVVDAYTARILRRHFLIDESADYEEIKELFESSLDDDVQLFNEYHALLVRCGKEHCRPKPRCDGCPLEPFEHDPMLR